MPLRLKCGIDAQGSPTSRVLSRRNDYSFRQILPSITSKNQFTSCSDFCFWRSRLFCRMTASRSIPTTPPIRRVVHRFDFENGRHHTALCISSVHAKFVGRLHCRTGQIVQLHQHSLRSIAIIGYSFSGRFVCSY